MLLQVRGVLAATRAEFGPEPWQQLRLPSLAQDPGNSKRGWPGPSLSTA